jgi:hypothetical protein
MLAIRNYIEQRDKPPPEDPISRSAWELAKFRWRKQSYAANAQPDKPKPSNSTPSRSIPALAPERCFWLISGMTAVEHATLMSRLGVAARRRRSLARRELLWLLPGLLARLDDSDPVVIRLRVLLTELKANAR